MDLKEASAALQARRDQVAAAVAAGELELPEAPAPAGPWEAHLPENREETPEPEGCPCRGRGWRVNLETRIVTRCDCQRVTYESPAAVPASELLARGVDNETAGMPKAEWKAKYEAWPREADEWPFGMVSPVWGKAPRWLYLWGPTGSGKSMVAAWIMRRAIAASHTAGWVPLRKTIRETQGKVWEGERQPIWDLLKYRLVVLDEVRNLRQDLSSHEDLIAQFVEERHAGLWWTVATSNLSPKQLRRNVPESVASRVLSGVRKEMKGPDARTREYVFTRDQT